MKKWRLSCFTVVISFLITISLSIHIDALRVSTSPVDDQRTSTIGSRGSSRFSQRRVTEDVPSVSISSSDSIAPRIAPAIRRSGRIGSSLESATRGTLVGRQSNEKPTTQGQSIERRISRSRTEIVNDDKILAENGPSVFAAGKAEYSRSRTGRKIQNPSSSRENDKTRPESRRWESRLGNSNLRNNGKSLDTTVAPEPRETTSIEAESVRVDIPLSLPRSESIEAVTIASDRLEATSETTTTRGRGRLRQKQNIAVGGSARRGVPGSWEIGTESSTVGRIKTGSDFEVKSSRRNSGRRSQVSESRLEGSEDGLKSRGGRGGARKMNDEVLRIDQHSKRSQSQSEEPGRRSGSRNENRQSRSRMEISSTTATSVTTESKTLQKLSEPESTVSVETEITTARILPVVETFSRLESTGKVLGSKSETRSNVETRRSQRDQQTTTESNEKRLKNISDESNVEITTSASKTISPSLNRMPKRRGMKRLEIRAKDEKEELSTATSIKSIETLNENGRRGGRGGGGKLVRKSEVKKLDGEVSEEDNYPADFKARLAQLNLKKPGPVSYSANGRSKVEKAKKPTEPNADIVVERTRVSQSTTRLPQSLPTRKSLFGKRPNKPVVPSTERKNLENAEKTGANKIQDVKTGSGNRPSFGKIRRIVSPEISKTSDESSKILETDLASQKTIDDLKNGVNKRRVNFAKRRSAPTTENPGGNDAMVSTSIAPSTTTSKPLNSGGTSSSRNVGTSRISRKGIGKNELEKSTKVKSRDFGNPDTVEKLNDRSTDLPSKLESDFEITTTTKPLSRYTRRKSDPKSFRKFDPVPKSSGEPEASVVARREFRPRTATYRRHSEAQPQPAVNILNLPITPEPLSIAVTPKSSKFRATFKSPSPLSATGTKTTNVRISENSTSGNKTGALSTGGIDPDAGIFGSSNGETGNTGTNIFNPSRSVILTNRNTSLLEQLRGTVAPLLSSLGLKSPVFAGAYRNVSGTGNSAMRITPSGQPPRFSARYKGAELFVRRPTAYQPTIPYVSGSTTPVTPLKVFGVSSPLEVSNPGESEILTYYQALETASVNNEQQTDIKQPVIASQVDKANVNANAKDINDTNNTNIDINTVPVFETRFSVTETKLNASENTISTGLEIARNQVLPTVANPGSSEPTPTSTPNPTNFETTSMPGAVDESMLTTTNSPVPNETSATSSTPIVTDANTIPTSMPDVTVTQDITEVSSPQNTESLARLVDATATPSPTTPDNLQTTTTFASIEKQETTTRGNVDSLPMSTAFPDTQTTQIPETTTAILETSSSPTVDSTTSFQSPDANAATTPVLTIPQTTPLVSARFSDSESPDATTIMSPTTPSLLEITAVFAATTDTSQVTNQRNTEATTRINSQSELSRLEIATDTSTLSLDQSDTIATTTTTTTPATTTLISSDILTTTPESTSDTLSTTTESLLSFDTVSATLSPSLARIVESFERMSTTRIPESTTIATEINPVDSTQFSLVSTENVLSATRIPVQEILTETTQSSLSIEMTTPFESMSVTTAPVPINDNFDISARLIDTRTTQDPILTITTIQTTETIPQTDGLSSQTTRRSEENFTTELTADTNTVTTESIMETSTTTTTSDTTLDPLNLITDTPNLLARLQDMTATATATVTAQGTAGLDAQATTRPNETSDTTPLSSPLTTPNILETTTIAIIPDPDEPTTISSFQMNADLTATTQDISTATLSSSSENTLAPTMAGTTTAMTQTTVAIDENLIAVDPETTTIFNEVTTEVNVATTNAMQTDQPTTTMGSSVETTTALPPPATTTPARSQTTMTTPRPKENLISTTAISFLGRFGGSRLTPAPRFSSSSSTTAPLRDYHVYGIYPNKTIVRKRPEDNLIDGRNVDSPYVIFGIYPDGKLVRKFPNGTVIPDPPSNPVEVVFSLSTSTTTTNRPGPVFYNQANPGYYNQISPIYNNRPEASIFNENTNRFDGIDLGFTGNTITGSTAADSRLSSVGIANKKMSDVLLETQMGTNSNTASEISDLLTTSPNSNTGGSTPSIPLRDRPIEISRERESEEASRSRDANGQRSSVYIGQEKFINYWKDNAPNTSPRVVSVRINSVASSSNIGLASAVGGGSSLPSFDILSGSQPRNPATLASGVQWNDPLDQIFGITTNSPVVTASVATNTLPENPGSATILPRPINPFVEVFTPVSSSIDTTISASTSGNLASLVLAETTTSTTTPLPITTSTTTTTPAPTSTSTTTTTTTTTPAPTTTTTTATPAPMTTSTSATTMPSTPVTTTTARILTTSASGANNVLRSSKGISQEPAFGNTFNDLAFLNSLLQPTDSGSSTQKTLSEAERFLADKILSLALGNVGATRSPKAIRPSNESPNSFDSFSGSKTRSEPIIISLLPSATTTSKKSLPTQATTPFTWKPVFIVKTTPIPSTTRQPILATWKPVVSVVRKTSEEITTPVATTSRLTTTTQKPETSTKPITTSTTTLRPKPRTTTPPPNQGFAAGLLTALFGSNPFAPAPTPVPTALKKPAVNNERLKTDRKPVAKDDISSSTFSPEQDAKFLAALLKSGSLAGDVKKATVSSSTFSPEDDARFLAAVLKSTRKSNSGVSTDDEAFLRTILSGKTNVEPASPVAAGTSGGNDAALLAELLKAQGIGPSTPSNNLQKQMNSATTGRPALKLRDASSTYPTSIFDAISNFGSGVNLRDDRTISGSDDGTAVRSQVVGAAIDATKAFSRFLGQAITGAAQQFQSFVRNGTKYVSEAVG